MSVSFTFGDYPFRVISMELCRNWDISTIDLPCNLVKFPLEIFSAVKWIIISWSILTS